MEIGVDAAELRRHKTLLYEQQSIVRRLLELSKLWELQEMGLSGTNMAEALQHRKLAEEAAERIQIRMDLIERIEQKTWECVRQINESLDESTCQLRWMEDMVYGGNEN